MRALVLVEPGPIGPPPEAMLGVLAAFAAWRDRWRPKMESFEFFAGRGGGWGVFDADETELSQAMMEFPFAPFSNIAVHPTVDGDEALVRLTETMKQMLSAMGA
jgi:muconolactone delta-isomerase